MSSFTPTALTVLFVSFALGICLTWGILQLASRWPWLARSSSNRLHVTPTPVWGGIAIFFSFMCVATIRGQFNNREAIVVAISASGVFALGLIDDVWKLRPRWKLLGQVFCALAPVSFVFSHPLTGSKVIDVLLALFWLVGITNAFNLLDNINGLSAGTAVLVSTFQAILFLNQGEQARSLASIAFGGAILGFLLFNFPKGRIFMGDSGSLFIGFWLAATTLTGTDFSEKNQFGSFLFPLLVMVVPICDTTLVTLTRILSGRSVSVGGTDHLSHRLIAYGLSQNAAVLALWAFSSLSGVLGITAVSYGLSPLLSFVIFLIVAVALFGTYLTRFELHTNTATPISAASRPMISVWVRISLRVLLDLVLIVAAYYTAYLLRFDGDISRTDMHLFVSTIAEIALIKLGVLVAFGTYRPWWDYFGLKDAYRLVGASILASLIAVTYFSTIYRFYGFSRIVLAVDFLVFTLLALVFRFSFRLLDEIAPANHRTNVLIYGADSQGETALQLVSKHYRCRVMGFIDDDRGKRNLSMHSVPIRGCTKDLPHLAKRWNAEVVILTPSTPKETIASIEAICESVGVRLMRLRFELESFDGLGNAGSVLTDTAETSSPASIPEQSERVVSKAKGA